MKNSFIAIVVSMSILCMYSCKNPNEEVKVTTGKEETVDSRSLESHCLNACYIKSSYYKVQLSKIKLELDSTIQTSVFDNLLALTEDIIESYNCGYMFNCPGGCDVPEPEDCRAGSSPIKDCVVEMIHRPECLSSKDEVEVFKMVDESGKTMAEADIKKGVNKNGIYEYPIIYSSNENYDSYTIYYKEKGSKRKYSVNFQTK